LLFEPGEVPTGEDPRSKASTALVLTPRASEEGWSVLLSKWSHTLDSSSRALARTGNERLLPFWNFLFNQKCRGKTCRITLPRIVISAVATPMDGHSRPVWLSGDEVQVELNNLMERAKQLWGGFLGDMFWGFWILGAHLLRFSLEWFLWVVEYQCEGSGCLIPWFGIWMLRLGTVIGLGFIGNFSGWWSLEWANNSWRPNRAPNAPIRYYVPFCRRRRPCSMCVAAKCMAKSSAAVFPAFVKVLRATLECAAELPTGGR